MDESDIACILIAAKSGCDKLLLTTAPETVSCAQVARLAHAGVTVSLGHSGCSAETAEAYFKAGATISTHLFNAMSQIQGRAPGLVGAALENGAVNCGLIADGVHVSEIVTQIALRAKQGPGTFFLVSDAMAITGSELGEFTLNGRKIYRVGGRLTLADGTLAGADISMLDAVRYCVSTLEVTLERALQMATFYPAQAACLQHHGPPTEGARADFLILDERLNLSSVWAGGQDYEPGIAA